MSLSPRLLLTRMATCAALCAALSAQQQILLNARPVVGAIGQTDSGDDPGVRVEMFENPNLDRYLRRAQSFLQRSDYTAAIEVLQDVVEGRTVEVVAVRPEGESTEQAEAEQPSKERPDGSIQTGALDARNSVFSHDGRLYRPVRRLCHELLAQMPDVGIEIYRTKYEFAADEMLAEALADGSTTALENVANRYFITLPAGRAMMMLADRLMHEGRYRGAVQVLRDLVELYPAQNRARLGIRDVWCRFKIALCLRLAGETEAAQAAVQELADTHPEESLRILGQLESIKDLPHSELFARDVVAIANRPDDTAGITWLTGLDQGLVPLWQFRFADPEPYRDPKPRKNRTNVWFDGSNRSSNMPFANRYGPGTWVAFGEERDGDEGLPYALFLEHYRLRLAEAASGLMLREGDGQVEPPVAKENHPRVRIAACDFALLRPIEDEYRRYVVLGYQSNTTSSKEALKASTLVAYDRSTWKRAWASTDWYDGEDGLRGVIFLAAPTVFGERLLLPSLRKGAYTLECLDRTTGRPLWRTPLHAGGSEFFKAPGCQVKVFGGVAFVATNAGCIAAVDAFAGDLRWIRRYERFDEAHKRRRKKRSNSRNGLMRGYGSLFPQSELRSFEPSDLILHDGLVVFAPVDGEVLLAIDAASGKPVWMLDGNTRYAPYGKLTGIVGASDELLFATSSSHLVCIELDGGLVRWQRQLPSWQGPKYSGRGHGTVVGDAVLVPNQRELLVFDVHNQKPMRRIPLPAFGEGREPLQGSCDVVAHGPWLAFGFQGGVEVFSTASALGELATVTEDPLRKATYLERSGDSRSAEMVLANTVRASQHDRRLRERAGQRLLTLVRERAFRSARAGDLSAALSLLDEVLPQMTERSVRLNWHLARIELCKAAGDMRTHSVEQEKLYEYMEGRG